MHKMIDPLNEGKAGTTTITHGGTRARLIPRLSSSSSSIIYSHIHLEENYTPSLS
uniref:Uncharacterized protein n=1 Tax=Physcomitrium patens TaxID=3218 RepID=A0A2K1IQR6_PHYPA|nr:hypothetical protein PHYPA_025744 [Physcomitrium patens]